MPPSEYDEIFNAALAQQETIRREALFQLYQDEIEKLFKPPYRWDQPAERLHSGPNRHPDYDYFVCRTNVLTPLLYDAKQLLDNPNFDLDQKTKTALHGQLATIEQFDWRQLRSAEEMALIRTFLEQILNALKTRNASSKQPSTTH
jgi:hypothetical protein